jgi:hypothetical protein
MKRQGPGVTVRLAAQGTRVVVLRGEAPPVAGVISDVRPQTHLRSYQVSCDDGTVVFTSGSDLALETDEARRPLAAGRPG